MVLFGDGSVAQVLLSAGEVASPGKAGSGNYQSISWGSVTLQGFSRTAVANRTYRWGLGVMLGIYVAGDSGGFLNPAITFCFCLYRGLPWPRFPVYLVAQFLGGFCAAGVIYGNYMSAIDYFEGPGIRTGKSSLHQHRLQLKIGLVPPSPTATAGVFCTYPQPFLTKTGQFFSEFITATLLMFVIFALKDESNRGAMGKTGAGPFFRKIFQPPDNLSYS